MSFSLGILSSLQSTLKVHSFVVVCDDKVTDTARAQNFVKRLRLSQYSGAPI